MATVKSEIDQVKVKKESGELYELALVAAYQSEEGIAKAFSSEELLRFDVVSDAGNLMPIVQALADQHRVRFLKLEDKIHFALRTKTTADTLGRLSNDERMVFNHIENSGTTGIWLKALKQRTSIAQAVIGKALKQLEQKGLIKSVMGIKNHAQRTYMLAHLSPSEGSSGGPWHNGGELDMEMVGVTADAVIKFIDGESWVKKYVKRERSISPLPLLSATEDVEDTVRTTTPPPTSKKRKQASEAPDIEGHHTKSRRYNRVATQISYPPGYKGYPTVASVHHFIKETGFIKSDVTLSPSDIESLLEVLVFDGRLERIGDGYRTVRGVTGASEAMKNMGSGKTLAELGDDAEGNGLTQAPCGRCPVFDLCEEGGPISATNCVYFDAWLKT